MNSIASVRVGFNATGGQTVKVNLSRLDAQRLGDALYQHAGLSGRGKDRGPILIPAQTIDFGGEILAARHHKVRA